jgi:ComF family protein
VHGFKYRGEWSLHARLTTWLEEAYEFHALSRRPVWDGLVPVPLHPIRRYWRRFNQAEELANELARRRGVPYLPCLRRIRFTPTQTNLDRPDRWRNMHDAFGLRRNYNVRGLHLLIVDDVFTTGATCDACARILRDNGAAEVGIITVARG